ncbi:hypothetical protein MTBLM5_20111 [Magnetospirillum sp. LM-5]|nr:hypothetical protein MTBLM5_20111 [Magnetospirillum sp. LM-5]
MRVATGQRQPKPLDSFEFAYPGQVLTYPTGWFDVFGMGRSDGGGGYPATKLRHLWLKKCGLRPSRHNTDAKALGRRTDLL